MDGKKPKALLSDQCASIECGIKNIFGDETLHRYCVWHIMNKLPTKLGNIVNKKQVEEDIKAIVYGSVTRFEFEARWNEQIQTSHYETNSWLLEIFGFRKKWVPTYLNHVFLGWYDYHTEGGVNEQFLG